MNKLKFLLAFCMVAIAASAENTYTVAGSVDAIFGTAWDAEATANDMTLTDGVYTKTYEGVAIDANTTIEYKVVKNHAWDESWGFSGNNAKYVVNTAGTYDITFSFNPDEAFSDGYNVACAITLSNAFTGEGKVFIKNVATNLWWGAGNSWGTHACLLPHADYVTLHKAGEGRYTMETQVNNGGTNNFFGGEWMDGAASNLDILKSGENYTVSFTNGGNYFGSGNETLVNGSQDLNLNVDANSEAALWQILTEADMRATLATATNDAPQDATWLIADHTFGRNNRGQLGNMTQKEGKNGVWKISDNCTNYSLGGGNSNKHCAESYHSVFTIQQTLTDIPNGWYALTAQGFYRQDGSDNDNLPQFFFGTKTANIPLKTGSENSMADACTSFESGLYKVDPIFVEVTDGTINVGIKNPNNASLWIIWDNFELTYYGTEAPISVLRDQLQATIDAGRTTVNALAVPQGVKNTFETTAAGYESAKSSYTTAQEFIDATDAIAAAIETAKEAINPTAENTKVLAKATAATTELAGLADSDKATLQTVIDGNADALAACTTAAEVEAQNVALWAAIGTAINSINVTDQLDLTFLLTNPNVDEFYTGNFNVHVDGWYTEQPDGNFQVVPGEGCANADDVHKHAYEYWSENPKANNKFLLYQKLQLPEGTYSIDCYAFADQATGGDVHGVYFYANDTEGSCVTTNTLAEQGISFVNDAQQEIKVGLKAMTGNTYRWVGIGYMQLFKVPAKTYTVSEDAAYDTAQEGAGAVTLTRTIKANDWNTIWLPFSMTADDLKATFGDDVAVAQYTETANTVEEGLSKISFNTMETPAISANVPVLLKTSTAGTSYSIEGRTIVAGTPTTTGTNFDFVGTTDATTTIASGDYFIGSSQLWQSAGSTTIKGTRAYIQAKTEGARIINFFIDGEETTGIQNVEKGTIVTGKVYNLNGQEVKSAQKGIFIQNGKKVILK